MEQTTYLTFTDPEGREAKEALLSWWRELDNLKGDRAELMRCHNPLEVEFIPAFHRLKMHLELFGSIHPDRIDNLAIVAGVLSHVTESKTESREKNIQRSFAVKMASPSSKKGQDKKACVSDLRFRRLLKIENRDELYQTMIRLIRLLGGSGNSDEIVSLANGIYWWNERTKKDWAFAYYENAPSEKKQGV